jgi:hypothetical protein
VQTVSFSISYRTSLEIGFLITIPISKFIDVQFFDVQFEDLQIYAFISMLLSCLFLILPDNLYNYFRSYFRPSNSNEKENNSLTRRYRNTIKNISF